MSEKYKTGTKLTCNGVTGTVVENVKLPGDICVVWEGHPLISYDEVWLNENAEIT